MMFSKSYVRTGIVIPVEKVPQERKKQESGGFLQELPTYMDVNSGFDSGFDGGFDSGFKG
jgi:hypothetical protein